MSITVILLAAYLFKKVLPILPSSKNSSSRSLRKTLKREKKKLVRCLNQDKGWKKRENLTKRLKKSNLNKRLKNLGLKRKS
jgi:hypothetical protein